MAVEVVDTTEAPTSAINDVEAIVVGAGFGGLRMMYELRQMGISALAIEAASDVGGTWFWNRYPGARTDSESWVYCYSFSKELQEDWDWQERFPSQPEVLRYLQHVTERFDLRKDIQFETRVHSAIYDEAANKWVITTDRDQTFRCTFFIPAMGPLSHPVDPPFEGLSSFEGEWHLTARWPEGEVDFAGKRVGVIGTGATGVQVVPTVAKLAAHVTVFQRTPNFVIAGGNRKLTDGERDDIKNRYDAIWARTQQHAGGFAMNGTSRKVKTATPDEQQQVFERFWRAGGFQFLFETFNDIMLDEESNEVAAEFIRSQIRAIVKNPSTAELLCPKGYPLGAKRPPLGHAYYEAYNRDNVTLVDVSSTPIERITKNGLRIGNDDHELDVLIFATGFDASTGALLAADIRGRDGRTLREKWEQGPRTYLGLAVDGFPNMFMISGPQSPFANIPVIIENAVRWIGRALTHQRQEGLTSLEATPDAVQSWVDETKTILDAAILSRGEDVHSWFLGANIEGKPHGAFFFHGAANTYFDRISAVADHDFEGFLTTRPHAAGASPVERTVARPVWAEAIRVRNGAEPAFRLYEPRPTGLFELFAVVDLWPRRTALIQGPRRVTFATLREKVEAIAAAFMDRGVCSGDHVLVLGRNSIEWLEALWATIRIGAVPVPANGWWTDGELAHCLSVTAPALVVGDASALARIVGDVAKVSFDDFDTFEPSTAALPSPIVDEDDGAMTVFTSGTTGLPKGAILSHRALIATQLSMLAASRRLPHLASPDAKAPVTLVAGPLFHSAGLQSHLATWLCGGTVILLDGRFNEPEVLAILEREQVSSFAAVPTMMTRLLDDPAFEQTDLSRLRHVAMGGAPVAGALLQRVSEAIPSVGRRVSNNYGLTETSGAVASAVGPELDERPGTSGRPFPLVETRVDQPDADGVGELCVRTPSQFDGYLAGEEDSIDIDGWVHTGDLARIDSEGYIFIVGRSKDVIIRGGENIAAAAVEAVLMQHTDLSAVAVVGVPDPDFGEIVGAVVVPRPGRSVDVTSLVAFAASRLAHFQVPARWYIHDEPLPTNEPGKVDKRELGRLFSSDNVSS